jgi:hypothetical protein
MSNGNLMVSNSSAEKTFHNAEFFFLGVPPNDAVGLYLTDVLPGCCYEGFFPADLLYFHGRVNFRGLRKKPFQIVPFRQDPYGHA